MSLGVANSSISLAGLARDAQGRNDGNLVAIQAQHGVSGSYPQITYRKRRQGLEDKTWQCAAAPRAPHCPALRRSLHPTCTFPASQHPPDSQTQTANPVVTLVRVCVAATK